MSPEPITSLNLRSAAITSLNLRSATITGLNLRSATENARQRPSGCPYQTCAGRGIFVRAGSPTRHRGLAWTLPGIPRRPWTAGSSHWNGARHAHTEVVVVVCGLVVVAVGATEVRGIVVVPRTAAEDVAAHPLSLSTNLRNSRSVVRFRATYAAFALDWQEADRALVRNAVTGMAGVADQGRRGRYHALQ